MINRKVVAIITAGRAATQIIDIFSYYKDIDVYGCFDDGSPPFACQDFDCPRIDKIEKIKHYYDLGRFTHAIVGISTSIELRKKFFELCVSNGIPMINAIHPSCTIGKKVKFGVGNVICGDTHIGTLAKIGNNNFISAKNSIEHHNEWGSHNTTGPCVITSGIVKVGSENKFGTGIFIEPFLEIGSNCTIGSQNVIISSMKDNMILRTKLSSFPADKNK